MSNTKNVANVATNALKDYYQNKNGHFDSAEDIQNWLLNNKVICTKRDAIRWDRQARLELNYEKQSVKYPVANNNYARGFAPTVMERADYQAPRLKGLCTLLENNAAMMAADAAQPNATAREKATSAVLQGAIVTLKGLEVPVTTKEVKQFLKELNKLNIM